MAAAVSSQLLSNPSKIKFLAIEHQLLVRFLRGITGKHFTQSRLSTMDATPIVLLIRPVGQSKRLLSEIEAAFGSSVAAVISPIIRIVPIPATYDLTHYSAVILTSVNAVRNAVGLYGKRVYCVGNRTRIAATKAGGEVFWTAENSEMLINRLLAERPAGRLVHLRGKYISVDIEAALSSGGLETESVIIYDQIAEKPGAALQAAMDGSMPTILPLYSPRSARLLGKSINSPSVKARVIAISPSVAEAWKRETGGLCDVCDVPDGSEMIGRIVAALKA